MMQVGSKEWNECITEGLRYFNMDAKENEVDGLTLHVKEMLKWNKKTNLTAIIDPYEVAVKHILDSSAAVNLIPESSAVLDIGTGGGFPGIPIKVLRPSIKLTLVDSSRKKINFLKHVIRMLRLDNAGAVQARAEELSEKNDFRGQFDIVTCRAFSALDNVVSMATPFLKKGGVIMAMKGRESDQEIDLLKNVTAKSADGKALTVNDFTIETDVYKLPFIQSERSIIRMKLKET